MTTLRFTHIELAGPVIVECEPVRDERGHFARIFCGKSFAEHGIAFNVAQCNLSYNRKKGTLRGLHYQDAPHQEGKLVRCIAGAAFDVLVDIRPSSPTYKHWYSLELTADDGRMVYIPAGFAHGFQSLVDDTTLLYVMDEYYHGDLSCGIRWNAPELNIKWPLSPSVISARDRSFDGWPSEC